MKSKVFGYGRVSSKDQIEERQLVAFKEYGIEERDIYIDKQSGKDFNREQYITLKHILRENDLLVIKSIDRLGRNYTQIIEKWRDITQNIKADIVVIDMPLLDTRNNKDLLGTFISDLVLQILSYVADQERGFIKQRQKEGIGVAKNKGIKFGKTKIEKTHNFDDVISKWKNKEIKSKEAMKLLGLKPNSFYNLLKNEKMEEALASASKRNVKTLIAHAVEHDGVVNAKKLLENFGFKEIYKVSNYWDSLYPGEYCKQCGNNSCHCGVVVFIKNL